MLLSLGVLSACSDSDQPERQVGQEPSNQRGKVLRLPHEQTHPNQRVALVIGNGAYLEDPLPNPPNDSDDMVTVLKQVGFEIMLLKDASLQKMKNAIQAFGEKLKKGGVGLFYFAGHGVQYQGKNYLFPIGAMQSVNVAELLPFETMDVGYLLATMEGAKNNLNVVILDACRNNPFARSLFIGRGVNSQNGLAMMEVPSGTLIAYATRPNKTALDGTAGGRNSPYVKFLKRELPKPGLSIVEVLTNVRVAVKKETKNRQAPGFYSELDSKFCFVDPCGQSPEAVQPVPSLSVADQVSSAAAPVNDGDGDGDGVVDNLDRCPDNSSAELRQGVYKSGSSIGCPIESDSDGVPDFRDSCPHNRSDELALGVDSRGCPLDSDGDGVADYGDRCLGNQSKEISAGVDSQGCPLDSDGDGVADYGDSCSRNSSKEISKGVNSRGCPLDSDRDGVADYRDKCSQNRSEELAQGVDSQGCPLDTGQNKVTDYQPPISREDLVLTTLPPTQQPAKHQGAHIESIDFRRTPEGAGRIAITLSEPSISVNMRQEGTDIVLYFPNTSLPNELDQRLDVLDFGTPISFVDTFLVNTDVRMNITIRNNYEHHAYQSGKLYILEASWLE
jgi:hypothetical protein